jgi:hypothetical protein
MKLFVFLFFLFASVQSVLASDDSTRVRTQDYQIYLKQPAKQIKLLMYEKDFTPIQGKISEDKKSIIIKDYKSGTKVHVKVEYEDGTIDEFVKSPCFIDPVITMIDCDDTFFA